MITFGKGSVYLDDVEIGEISSGWATLESENLSKHFKSVKLNGEELISDRKDKKCMK